MSIAKQAHYRLGSRRSALALMQADMVSTAITQLRPGTTVEIVEVVTTGDKRQGTPEAQVQDKKEWIFEIEQELLRGNIDFAVHSAKDVPYAIEAGTSVCSLLAQESPFDFLLVRGALFDSALTASEFLAQLPPGAKIGTSSLRRGTQIRRLAPHLIVEPVRGNVPTRIAKLESDEHYSAIVLAEAGLNRLNIPSRTSYRFSLDEMLPAVTQGILAGQYVSARSEIKDLLIGIQDQATEYRFVGERAAVEELQADCNSAVSVYASVSGAALRVQIRVEGRRERTPIEVTVDGALDNASDVGRQAASEALRLGARDLLEDLL